MVVTVDRRIATTLPSSLCSPPSPSASTTRGGSVRWPNICCTLGSRYVMIELQAREGNTSKSDLSPSLFFSFSPSPQTHFSNQGYLLRFLAMIWTAPVQQGMEPGPGNQETLSWPGTSLSVSPATQASSLAVFSAYLSSLPSEAILALTTPLCPGTLMIRACS